MRHSVQGHPRQMGPREEFWQNMVYWRRKWQATLVFLPQEPHEHMKTQKRYDIRRWPPRTEDVQCATGAEQRTITNSSRRKEEAEPKRKQHPAVDVIGDGSTIWCCKEQYCIGTWNARSMNQGKLDMVKQEMARVNINILEINELKWTGMGEFNSDDHYIYYCGQESHRRNGVAIIIK